MPRWPAESAGFSTAGKPTVARGGAHLGLPAERRELRLRHAALGELAPHRDLVRRQVRRLGADPGQAEQLCDARDDRDGAVGGHRHDAVDRVLPADLGDGLGVGEVDRLARVGDREPGRVGVPVDRDDAPAELLHALDRPPLVPAGADEENRLHRAMLIARAHARRLTRRLQGVDVDRRAAPATREREAVDHDRREAGEVVRAGGRRGTRRSPGRARTRRESSAAARASR